MASPSANPLTAAQRGDPAAREVARLLAVGRIAIGAGLAVAPQLSMRLLGFDRPSDQTVVVSRLAGGRDLVMGATTLLAVADPDRLARASIANAAVDAGDAASFAAAFAGGERMRAAAVRGLAAAIPATLAGIWIALRLRRRPAQRSQRGSNDSSRAGSSPASASASLRSR